MSNGSKGLMDIECHTLVVTDVLSPDPTLSPEGKGEVPAPSPFQGEGWGEGSVSPTANPPQRPSLRSAIAQTGIFVLTLIIRANQLVISPLLIGGCRQWPT